MSALDFLQSGSFNVRLGVESPIETDDGCGGTQTSWQHQFDVWVRLVPVKGVLIHQAQNEMMDITHWVYLRHRDDLKKEMRFVSQSGSTGRVFEIETLFDPDETRRYLQCQTREIE